LEFILNNKTSEGRNAAPLQVHYDARTLETYNVLKNISILWELLQYKRRCSRWKTTTTRTY